MDSLVHTLLSNALAVTFMAVVVAGLAWIWQRPAVTHSLWLLVMLKLITPPLVPVSLPVGLLISSIRPSLASSPVDRDASSTTTQVEVGSNRCEDQSSRHDVAALSAVEPAILVDGELDFITVADSQRFSDSLEAEPRTAAGLTSAWRWELLFLAIGLVGALGWWALATVRIIHFQRLLKHVSPVPGEWQSHADELAVRLGLGACPTVCLVPGRVPPMLWAIGGRPRLLLPSQLWARMGTDERTSLLLHELAHLKRRDHWARWLELVVIGLYWWHPVAWWARRALREAEEQCCDAWVVWAMPERARTYATALLAAVEFVSGAPIVPAVASATGGGGHVSCLKKRLKMIVRANTPKGLSWAGRIALLGTAALVLPLTPSWAQNKELTQTQSDRPTGVDEEQRFTLTRPSQGNAPQASKTVEDRAAEKLKKDPELLAIASEIDRTRERLAYDRSAHDFRESLKNQLLALSEEIKSKRDRLRELYRKSNIVVKHEDRLTATNADISAVQPVFKTVSETHVKNMMDQIDQNELELIEAAAMLDVMREDYKAREQERHQPPNAQLLARIKDEFKKDPDVLALKRELDETREHLDRIKRTVRASDDASRVAAQNQFDKLQQQFNELWESKQEEIRQRLTAANISENGPSPGRIRQLEQKVNVLREKKAKLADLFKAIQVEQKATNDDTFEAAYLTHQVQSLLNWEEIVKKNLEQVSFDARQEKHHLVLSDPDRLAAEKRLSALKARYENLRKAKHDQVLALLTRDETKVDNGIKVDNDTKVDDKEATASDAAEGVKAKVKELLDKLSKELSPIGEEVRKALEEAVGDLHKSLENEGLSPEDLSRALDNAQKDLRKAFEGGGAVDKEVREAIEKARKDLQETFDRARGDLRNQVDSLRPSPRKSKEQASPPKAEHFRDIEKELNHDDLDSTRREIHSLEQRLRAATRRLELLEQRKLKPSPRSDRSRKHEPLGTPELNPVVPDVMPAPIAPRNAQLGRGGRGLGLPGEGAMRRGSQMDTDRRFRELEDKIKALLKEVESLKGEKNSKESKDPSSSATPSVKRPSSPTTA